MAWGTDTKMLSAVVLVASACDVRVFRVREWKCVQGGQWPYLQFPGLCDKHNPYVRSVFDVFNVSDGATWALDLHPERSFAVDEYGKHDMYRFELTRFECESLDDYHAEITVVPVREIPPLTWVALVIVVVLVVVCLGEQEGRSSVRPHFE